jgi:plastocyanin
MRFSFLRYGPTLAPALLTLILSGCIPPPAKTTGATESSTAPSANHESPAQVVIDNFTYAPAILTIAPGTKVTWVNHDDVPHTVTSPSKPRLLDSSTLDTDDKFSFVFEKAGTYDYFCAVHPKMTGKIIVK